MLRSSSYTIYVDLPGNKEDMLLVHGYTGAYDKVSLRVATYLRSLEIRKPPKPLYGDWSPESEIEGQTIHPSESTIEILKKRGYLTELSPEQEEEAFTIFADRLHRRNMRQPPSYIFMPTYNCNLRCSYCFQDHMRTDTRFGHLLRTMKPEIVDRIFAALPSVEAMHGIEAGVTPQRQIGFFGGEPLLEACRPIVQYIIDKARASGPATFWAVTNATDLHFFEEVLSPEGIAWLQITIDGPPREHDKRRIYADGSGSYERIARNISMALDRGVKVSIRLNLDRNNLHMVPEMAEDFLARGWRGKPQFSVYAAPIRAENDKTDAGSTFDTWELGQALSDLRQQYPVAAAINTPDNSIKHQARNIFLNSEDVAPSFRESFCSAHSRMYIFDSFADIYACWERTGDPSIRIGHIGDHGEVEINAQVLELWRTRTVTSNPVCRRCRYALQCGGGCAVLAAGSTGSYHMNFCDGYASRFRSSVAEAYLDQVNGKSAEEAAAKICDQ